jgi:hypothetical protein
MVPHKYGEVTGLQQLGLLIQQDDLKYLWGLLLQNQHLWVFFPFGSLCSPASALR